MLKRNNVGPNIESCGTPALILDVSETQPS